MTRGQIRFMELNLDEIECKDIEYDGKIIPKENAREIGKFAQLMLRDAEKHEHLSVEEMVKLARQRNRNRRKITNAIFNVEKIFIFEFNIIMLFSNEEYKIINLFKHMKHNRYAKLKI